MIVDLRRLGELQHLMGADASQILEGLLDSMRGAIDRIEQAVAGDDLPEAASAAHVCRNDGLIVGASELLAVLQTVEQAARHGELATARMALATLREVWTGTREALERALGTQGSRGGISREPACRLRNLHKTAPDIERTRRGSDTTPMKCLRGRGGRLTDGRRSEPH